MERCTVCKVHVDDRPMVKGIGLSPGYDCLFVKNCLDMLNIIIYRIKLSQLSDIGAILVINMATKGITDKGRRHQRKMDVQ